MGWSDLGECREHVVLRIDEALSLSSGALGFSNISVIFAALVKTSVSGLAETGQFSIVGLNGYEAACMIRTPLMFQRVPCGMLFA